MRIHFAIPDDSAEAEYIRLVKARDSLSPEEAVLSILDRAAVERRFMNHVDLPDLTKQIRRYAEAQGYDFDEACSRLLSRGLAVYRSEQTAEKIPDELKDLIVSDYHTVSGWARFKGTRMPLQVLVENLLAGSTPEQFLEDYGSITLEDIALVQAWLKTLPPWDGKDEADMPEAYRFMFQED